MKGHGLKTHPWYTLLKACVDVGEYMVQVRPTFYPSKAIVTLSPVQDVCGQCAGYQKSSLSCIAAELTSKSAASKCQICRTRGVACEWGKNIPRQMNPIKLKIHSTDHPILYSNAKNSSINANTTTRKKKATKKKDNNNDNNATARKKIKNKNNKNNDSVDEDSNSNTTPLLESLEPSGAGRGGYEEILEATAEAFSLICVEDRQDLRGFFHAVESEMQ